MRLILDTNIIHGDFYLQGSRILKLCSAAPKLGYELMIPEVVYDEMVDQYRRELEKHVASYEKVISLTNRARSGSVIKRIDRALFLEEKVSEYKTMFSTRLEDLLIQVIPYPAIDIKALVSKELLRKKPFTRGGTIKPTTSGGYRNGVSLGTKVTAKHSTMRRTVVSQDQYMAELDPYMHTVLFDENIPSICVKTAENGAMEIKFVKSAFPFQQCIMEKQTLHMACLPMKFTLSDKKPTDSMQEDFVTFKHYWDLRNQDGMKVKMVQGFYFDKPLPKEEFEARLLQNGYL